MKARMQGIIYELRKALARGQKNTRILLLGLLLILVLLTVVSWGVSAYQGYAQSLQQEIEVKENRYNSLAKFIADAERYKKEHAALVQFQEDYLQERMIQASTASLAEAQFQDLVNNLAEEAGLNVRSMRTRSREEAQGITMLRIHISSRGKIEAIQSFLQQVSKQEKFIFVDEIEAGMINRRERRYFNFNAQIIAWTKI